MPLLSIVLLLSLGCSDKTDPAADDTAGGSETGDPASNEDADQDGYTPADGDCNDYDPAINPSIAEVACDGIDQNCDGVDLDDVDGDGHKCEGVGGDDCDDFDPTVNPSAADECGDQIDVNCDGDPECDCDGDTYESFACGGDDCDDFDEDIWPWAPDDCYDGVDSDCNGVNDFDCDGDGYASADYDGTDCDDSNYMNNPGAAEICYDGADNDCDDSTLDCDCDLDGHEDPKCGGDDCDDERASVYPEATEAYADNLDNDCDTEVDEGAYCNLYAPLTNITTGANKTYEVFYDGSTLTEVVTPTDYDPKTGAATLTREWTGTLAYTFTEDWICDSQGVSMEGWDLSVSGIPLVAPSFGSARTDLLTEFAMTPGTSWNYEYIASDPAYGDLWTVSGTITVASLEPVTVAAGTFDALVLTNDYEVTDSISGLYDRLGVVTMFYVERLGLVLSEDLLDDGVLFESRELTAFSEFYP